MARTAQLDRPAPRAYSGIDFEQSITIDPAIETEICDARLRRVQGIETIEDLESHATLARLKIAALFAILDGRTDINLEDWSLAATFKAASRLVRTQVLEAVAIDQRKTEERYTRRHVAREAAVNEDAVGKAVERMARAIGRHVHRAACEGGCKRQCVSRAVASRDRSTGSIDDAIDHAVALQWIAIDETSLNPGSARPT